MAARKSEERRQQLIEALMRTMSRDGYAGATVASIAREAGLAPGLVHYYFKSKREILLALMGVIRARSRTRVEERDSRADMDPEQRLFAVTDALLAVDRSGATGPLQRTWLLVAAEAVHEPEIREEYGRMLQGLIARLDKRLREVLVSQGRSTRGSRSLAAAIAAAIQGVYQIDAAAPGASRRGSSAPAVRHMIEGLVRAQPLARARSSNAKQRAKRASQR